MGFSSISSIAFLISSSVISISFRSSASSSLKGFPFILPLILLYCERNSKTSFSHIASPSSIISPFKENGKINGNPFKDEEADDLNDIEITEEDIKKAIDDIDENSAAGPDGIPAILLKRIRDEIALPLTLILRKSIDEGKKPLL